MEYFIAVSRAPYFPRPVLSRQVHPRGEFCDAVKGAHRVKIERLREAKERRLGSAGGRAIAAIWTARCWVGEESPNSAGQCAG